ncbi:hypothetical protein [Haladaptatus halobius]|uniref:hypothetical protein n=1 Tax=Haladaptatus halobius TaxID=2884875 RepID=UPI001D0B8F2D|nr:hypothetical protein [Haladaptatus halobius]
MDRHDYNRIWGWALKENSSQWIRNLALSYTLLTQRGVIRPINYAQFYQKSTQQRNLRQAQTILKRASDNAHTRAAKQGAKGWLDFSRGDYQASFRAQLGEDPGSFGNARQLDKARWHKLKRGGGEPSEWNKRVFAQYLAALHVRQYADKALNLDVKRIIGQGESAIIREILNAKKGQYDGALSNHLLELEPDKLGHTREALDIIGEIAAEITGTEHNEWAYLAPTLAIPQSHELFKLRTIKSQLHHGLNMDTLVDEGSYVVDALKQRTEHNPSMNVEHAAEWLAESEHIPGSPSKSQQKNLVNLTTHAVNLSEYSPELERLVKRDGISRAGALIGYSVMADPSIRGGDEYMYQQCENLINRFRTPELDEEELMAFRRRKEGWDDNPDWYLDPDRQR